MLPTEALKATASAIHATQPARHIQASALSPGRFARRRLIEARRIVRTLAETAQTSSVDPMGYALNEPNKWPPEARIRATPKKRSTAPDEIILPIPDRPACPTRRPP